MRRSRWKPLLPLWYPEGLKINSGGSSNHTILDSIRITRLAFTVLTSTAPRSGAGSENPMVHSTTPGRPKLEGKLLPSPGKSQFPSPSRKKNNLWLRLHSAMLERLQWKICQLEQIFLALERYRDITPKFIALANENHIHPYSLIPHLTHCMQTLDVGSFSTL